MRWPRILALVLAAPAGAQDAADIPRLEVTFEVTETIPGQPLDLRLTVLVPTFMPDPPVWPSLEAPNLLVRLPEGSTGPTSQRVGSATWSGVTRRYRIAPMVPGEFSIPPQEVTVTYADPETNDPVQATVPTDALSFTGVVPDGAEGLDPFIAANALDLTQEIEGMPDAMIPGDSVTRTVTATIRGTSPMFLSDLLPPTSIDGIAAYPDAPAVEESEDRGVVSGTRTESVTLVAEGGGSGDVRPVSVDWYNLDSGQVETASVEGFSITVDGPAASAGEPRDWRAIGLAALAALVLVVLLLALLRRAGPGVARRLRARREARLASEAHAYAVLARIVRDRDRAALHPALDEWAGRVEGPDPRRHAALQTALLSLGGAIYGPVPGEADAAWHDLRAALPEARRAFRAAGHAPALLPPLNPGA